MGNGIGGGGFHAISAENAAVVVDVVDLGVAIGAGNALLGGVFVCLNIDAIGGAGRSAQEAGYALLQAIFVALQDVGAAEPVLKVSTPVGAGSVRIILYLGWLEHLAKRDAHSLGQSCYVAHNRHATSIRWRVSCAGVKKARP